MTLYRPPQVAGYFYPDDPFLLRKTIEACFLSKIGPGKLPQDIEEEDFFVRGLISPHAGYIYSGGFAAWGFLRIAASKKPRTVIIMGPNHRGLGVDFSIFPEGIWETPLGKVKINDHISQFLMKKCDFLQFDEMAHTREHSIEVQLPFLQYVLNDDFTIVPIAIFSYSIDKLKKLGKAISSIENKDEVLVLASSDFSHYINAELAKKIDMEAIKHILNKDAYNFFRKTTIERFSICGIGPITSLLFTVKNEDVDIKLLRYGNSGDITGDYSEVVAYGSISFEKILKR